MTTKRFSLEGKVCLITGATGILGRRFCFGLIEAGATVVVTDVDEDACQALAAQLSEQGTAVGYRMDVTDPASVDQVVTQTVRDLGGIDVLHNNAATKGPDLKAFFAPFETFDLDLWREIMDVNVGGMFVVAQRVGRQMIRQGRGGSVIQTGSIYGVVAPDQRIYDGSEYMGGPINTPAVYSASKAAVVGLSKYLSTYWGEHAIRVNTLIPGGVASGQNDRFAKNYSARIPLGRMAEADEMIGTLVFLASDASSYTTGQEFCVDGGLTAW